MNEILQALHFNYADIVSGVKAKKIHDISSYQFRHGKVEMFDAWTSCYWPRQMEQSRQLR